MKVPFAKKWQQETAALRALALACGLGEECKWSKPCFTFAGRNVAIVIPLKESCAFSFFQGAMLKDPGRLLARIGQAQAGRWIKFTSVAEIAARRGRLRGLIREAIAVEKAGKRFTPKPAAEYPMPAELQAALASRPEARAAFEVLTPGRRKSFMFYVAVAKRAATREARAEACLPKILSGRGWLERRR